MIFAAKLASLAVVAFGAALAHEASAIVEPGLSQTVAVSQFDDTADADHALRTYDAARVGPSDLLWLAVPVAAALFAGDVTRCLAARR